MKAKTFLFAFLTWFIPVAVSVLMYDPQSNEYLPNFIVFKLVMLLLLFGLTFYFFQKIKKYEISSWVKISTVFILICSILDFAVVVAFFNVSISTWVMAIFPFYIISFYGLGFLMLRKMESKA